MLKLSKAYIEQQDKYIKKMEDFNEKLYIDINDEWDEFWTTYKQLYFDLSANFNNYLQHFGLVIKPNAEFYQEFEILIDAIDKQPELIMEH